MIDAEFLSEQVKKLDVNLTKDQIKKFDTYAEFLLEYNKKVNLTSIVEPNDIIIKHFYDSLILLMVVDLKRGSSLIDVGTGAGFPGVPIKIVRPDINLFLLDSLNKRLIFLRELMSKLGLNSEILHMRAENAGNCKEFREKFDFVTSRAVATLNILAEYCLPLVKIDGYFIALKGPNIDEELDGIETSLYKLGGKIVNTKSFILPDGSKRNLILIKKVSKTPEIFPRNSLKIAKKPL